MSKYVIRLRRKAQIRFVIALAIFVLAGIFVVIPKMQEMSATKEKITITDKEILKNTSILELERDKYRDMKSEYSLRAATDEKTIMTILPGESAETDIVRFLEEESIRLAGDEPNSFSLEAVNFGSSKEDQDNDYLNLPLSIDIAGDEEKLMDFVRFLEKTGDSSVEGGAATRLLAIKSIDLQLPEEADDEIQIGLEADAFFMEDSSE